jgi:hypothetical protein
MLSAANRMGCACAIVRLVAARILTGMRQLSCYDESGRPVFTIPICQPAMK